MVNKKVYLENPPPEKKLWEHKNITLDMPNSVPLEGAVEIKDAYIMHFDGGCSKKKGSGGFVVWSPEGKCIGGAYKYYGDKRPTCN